MTYHPILNSLSKTIGNNMHFLNMNEEVRKNFSPDPMVSFQSAPKLSSYLVLAKLYPLQRKVISSKCGKQRCEVCNNVTNSTRVKLQICFVIDGITIKSMLESLTGNSLVCRVTYITYITFAVRIKKRFCKKVVI